MRSNRCRIVLPVSLLLLLTFSADCDKSNCSTLFLGPSEIHIAQIGQLLRINCTVEHCSDSQPRIVWYKGVNLTPVAVQSPHITTQWEDLEQSIGKSFLEFQNITITDSGLYRCTDEFAWSYTITVTVHADDQLNRNSSLGRSDDPLVPPPNDLQMYLYTTAGIVPIVIIVIIVSVISMHRCKGARKKKVQSERQCVSVPMAEQSYSTLRPSPKRSAPASPLCSSTENQSDVLIEENNSLVYVTLNHQLPPGALARPQLPVQDRSEYAAIRVV